MHAQYIESEVITTTVDKLDKNLNKVINDFSSEVRTLYPEGSKETAIEGDLSEVARQVTYALDEFRKEIINYLKESE